MGTELENGRFCWVDLASHDMEASFKWYGNLFGWEQGHTDESGPSPYAMIQLGNETVAGMGEMTYGMKASMPPVWNNYVQVEDCAATVARAQELGANVIFDTHEVGGGMGKLAFLNDPTGAVVALWQSMGPGGSSFGNEPGHFCWQELRTGDPDAAKAFYSELFGWTLNVHETPGAGNVLMVSIGDEAFAHMMHLGEQEGQVPPHWAVYFSVEDADATCATVKETGGKVVAGPMDIPVGRFALIADPQGAMFYVIQLT